MGKFAAILSIIILVPISDCLGQQTVIIDGYTIPAIINLNGEPLPNWVIPEIVVFPQRKFKSKKDYRQYQRMIRNLKIVYPYARIARIKLMDMNYQLTQLHTKKEKEKYINQVEKEIRDEFEKKLMGLSISQGKMLIKLIDRETGETSYQLLKELKGGFSAGFWQAVARIFGSNLKSEFDEEGEDKILNELIMLYEHQQL
ncbi:MAG TPA: DUF4294 domain-containing protein [Bacteroidales bacterium]|nr:DUF4294 domain-containing protein [Bacteroidales bacterium]